MVAQLPSYDAVAESFFSSLKKERVRRNMYRTYDEARVDLFDYIEMFYNPKLLSLLKTPSAMQNLHLRLFYYIIDRMLKIILRTIFSTLRPHRALTLANLTLRHQLEAGLNSRPSTPSQQERWHAVSRT